MTKNQMVGGPGLFFVLTNFETMQPHLTYLPPEKHLD